MVSKCANPKCNAHLKYLHEGSLFVVPRSTNEPATDDAFSAPTGNQIECFWLCESCSPRMRISGRGELVLIRSVDMNHFGTAGGFPGGVNYAP